MPDALYLPESIPELATQHRMPVPPSRNPALVYIASLSAGSRRTMRHSMQTIVDIVFGYDPSNTDDNPNRTTDADGNTMPTVTWHEFPWHELRYQHTAAVRAVVVSYYKKRTAVKMLSAMRRVLKECWRLGYMDVETYQRAVDLDRISGESLTQAQVGRHVERSEILALLQACADGTVAGVRDAALIAIAYNCGLRRSELSGLNRRDVDMRNRSLHIVGGKGDKERLVYIGNHAMLYLQAWFRHRGDVGGAVFGSISKAGELKTVVEGDGRMTIVPNMTDQAVYNIFKRRAKLAMLEDFSPHDIRRTFAGNLLDAGIDLATVQKLMGHSDPGTTAGYDRRNEQVKKDAIDRLSLPLVDGILHTTK